MFQHYALSSYALICAFLTSAAAIRLDSEKGRQRAKVTHMCYTRNVLGWLETRLAQNALNYIKVSLAV